MKGIPRMMIVICHLDQLDSQGLDLHLALVARVVVATLQHVLSHGHVDVCICPGGIVKLLLDLHITPDHDEVCVQLRPLGAMSSDGEATTAGAARGLV